MKWLLIAFIATRAIAPVGFMPNAISSGMPFALCGGDIHSAQWLAVSAKSGYHVHHQHHHSEAHSFFDNLCDFAVLGLAASLNNKVEIPFTLLLSYSAVEPTTESQLIIRPYQRPLSRAPPLHIS